MLTFFLAKRFFKNGNHTAGEKHNASAPAIRIATAGIAIGLAVMIVSVCLVKGFQREVSNKLTGFVSHLQILDNKFFSSPESYPIVTDAQLVSTVKACPFVEHVQRVSNKMGVFKTQDDFAAIALKGVGQDYDLTFMKSYMVEGTMPAFSAEKSGNSVVISRRLAQDLGLKVGSKVYSYFFAETIKQRRFVVAGIFDTHLPQFDKNIVLTDLYTVNKLNGWMPEQSSTLEVRLKRMEDIEQTEHWLAPRVTGRLDRMGGTYSVLSLHRNFQTAPMLSWLDALNTNIMLILVIMMVVAGITMISGLLILIIERTSTIGVLKALGASNRRVRHTFLWFAAFIIGRGLLIGNVIAFGLLLLQQHFKPVHLNPEVYYVDTVPVEFDWLWIIGINIASLLLTMLALILPSFLVSRVQPAKAIQFD